MKMNVSIKRQFVCAIMLAAAMVSCSQQQQSPQDLKEQTAKETAALKHDAKAVAQGVREGWNRDDAVNLNTASKDQLLKLPGMTSAQADRVIAGRPYDSADELVAKHILPKAEYDEIADRVTTKK